MNSHIHLDLYGNSFLSSTLYFLFFNRLYAPTCRILPLKRVAEEKARAIRAAAASSFKCMLQEKADITTSSRWSKVGASVEVLLPVGRCGLFCFSSGMSK